MTITTSSLEAITNVITKKGKEVKVDTNEEPEWRLDNPLLKPGDVREWPEEKLRAAMNKEMASMRDFDVYEEISLDSLTPEQKKKVIKSRWVLTWKKVRTSRRD